MNWMLVECDTKRKIVRIMGTRATDLKSIALNEAKIRSRKGTKVEAIRVHDKTYDELTKFLKNCNISELDIASIFSNIDTKLTKFLSKN